MRCSSQKLKQIKIMEIKYIRYMKIIYILNRHIIVKYIIQETLEKEVFLMI